MNANLTTALASVLGGLNALQASVDALAARMDAVEDSTRLLDSLVMSPPMPTPRPTPPAAPPGPSPFLLNPPPNASPPSPMPLLSPGIPSPPPSLSLLLSSLPPSSPDALSVFAAQQSAINVNLSTQLDKLTEAFTGMQSSVNLLTSRVISPPPSPLPPRPSPLPSLLPPLVLGRHHGACIRTCTIKSKDSNVEMLSASLPMLRQPASPAQERGSNSRSRHSRARPVRALAALPSDLASFFATVPLPFGSSVATRESAKQELLSLLPPLDRGVAANEEQQEAVEKAVQRLERLSSGRSLASPAINGRWELVYTTSASSAS